MESENEMDMEKLVKTFQHIVNNKLSKKLLNKSLKYCDKCGKSRL